MKWVLKIARLGLVVVMVSLLTVVTTGYVVNMYIHSLLSSYNLPIAGQMPSLSDMMKGMLGFGSQGASVSKDELDRDNKGQTGLNPVEASVTDPSGEDNTLTDREENGGNPGSSPVDGDVEEEAPEGSIPVMGGIVGEATGDAQDQQVLVTPDDLLAKKDELSANEKEEVFATLMSKLPQEEMMRMSEVIEGGLTETEMIEIEQILSKHLSTEEYTKILKLLKK